MGLRKLLSLFSMMLIALSGSVANAQFLEEELEPESLLKKMYLGAGIGYSFLKTDISGAPTENFDNDFGGRILLGLDVNEHFSLELNFSDYGTAKLSSGGEVDYESFAVNTNFYLFSKGRSGRSGYSGVFKVGLEKIDTATSSAAVIETSRQFTLGIGGEYGWDNGYAVQVSAHTVYREVNMLSVNLLYRFDHQQEKEVEVVLEVFDSDADGVMDKLDRCPDTKPQRTVDNIGCEFDEDNDGVADGGDECPLTPLGTLVDRKGCMFDTDNDGVENGVDQCRATPPGVSVDQKGCAIDSDNDGVEDSSDQCPSTPEGMRVDHEGCIFDNDKDGVEDDSDRCPVTPLGDPVDEGGCTIDGDGDHDGVLDSVDQCPDTIFGADVNIEGCAIFESTLDGVNFTSGSSDLNVETRAMLDVAVAALLKFPEIRVEIQAHTDSEGSSESNLNLSETRANSVADYLESKGISRDRMVAVGFGEMLPLASNETSEGRSKNRRVEFHVLSGDE